jgi:hypothetical protein
MASTQTPFQSGDWATGGEWGRLMVSTLVWIAIPLTPGVIRLCGQRSSSREVTAL